MPTTGCVYFVAAFGYFEVQVEGRRDFGKSLKVKQDPSHPETLIVSGSVYHSSWGINDMRLVKQKDTIIIKMHLKHGGFGRENLRGDFTSRIEVPRDVNFV